MQQNIDRFKLFEDFCEELLTSTTNISASPSADALVRNVFFVFFAKARTFLKSIVILNKEKLYPSVYILLRSLLELCIQMKWISVTDVVRLSKRYADLSNVIRMRAYLRTKSNWGDFLNSCKDEAFLKRFDENTQKAHLYGYGDIMAVSDWKPMKTSNRRYRISDMAKDISMDYDYVVVYNRLCETTHIGPGSDLDYEVIPQGRGLVPRKPTEPTELISAAKYFLEIFALTNKAMGQSFKEATYHNLKFENILLKALEHGIQADTGIHPAAEPR